MRLLPPRHAALTCTSLGHCGLILAHGVTSGSSLTLACVRPVGNVWKVYPPPARSWYLSRKSVDHKLSVLWHPPARLSLSPSHTVWTVVTVRSVLRRGSARPPASVFFRRAVRAVWGPGQRRANRSAHLSGSEGTLRPGFGGDRGESADPLGDGVVSRTRSLPIHERGASTA